jgi:hypothetical protein
MAIICPQCGWRFNHQIRWICDECQQLFYTFDHQGVCPSCGHAHEMTVCPRCHVNSLHESWYREDEPSIWERLRGKKKKKKRDESL